MLSWARPANWHTYWSMFLNGQTPSGYWRIELADRIDVLWTYPSYDLTWAGLALAAVGLAACAMRDRAVAAFFVTMLIIDAIIVETYSIHNIYNYLTPAYLVLCVLIGIAASWLRNALKRAMDTAARANNSSVQSMAMRRSLALAGAALCLALL